MKHGDKIECPTCDAPATFDIMEGNEAEFDDACWINTYTGEYECYNCWLK